MSKHVRNRLLVVLGVILASVYFAFPIEKRINLGLDLQGGIHLVIQVETEKLDKNARQDALERAIEILRNRIDPTGGSEIVIQRQGESQILIQLPGIHDRETALKKIGTVAELNFHLVSPDPLLLKEAMDGKIPDGYALKYTKEKEEPVLIGAEPALRGEAITDARVDFDSMGFNAPQISLSLGAKGAKIFAEITRKHVNERLAIVLDGTVLSAPNINEPILTGSAQITGQFSMEEASLLALNLRSGSLPAPMHIEEERTIGPLLGRDSIHTGIKATLIGCAAVLVFMLIYYFKAGLVANIALAANLLLLIGLMGFVNALLPESQLTLTLPGIAGILLTLGMAVDANVLINERIREELQSGRPMHAAISNGFNKAFNAIWDSNVTSLIAAFMLFQFGSGPIKGFAVTLSIGLLSSLFTALFVTRTLFLLLLEINLLKTLPMLRIFSQPKFDFISKGLIFSTLSVVVITVGLYAFFQKGDDAYGIDFVGGQIQEYRFASPVSAQTLREYLQAGGVNDAVIQQFDQHPENVIIRTPYDTFGSITQQDFSGLVPDPQALWKDLVSRGYINEQGGIQSRLRDLSGVNALELDPVFAGARTTVYETLKHVSYDKVMRVLKEKMPDNPFEILRIEKVGPVVGKALRQAAMLAIIYALGGILIYVGFRFKHFDFATAGIIALLHDVVITLGVLAMMGRQVDLLVITALLTIAGYSINDTIVIYDRVRENMAKSRKEPLKDIINNSINQTLGRTILTTFATLLTVIVLYLIGGEVLNTFALSLIIGFIAGTYSTVFIAPPLVLAWEKRTAAGAGKKG
jgi:protein-export membrane protein SecD/preprotein translocase SecF subunit